MVTSVAIAGATGSIGTQTADVIAANPERFAASAIGANRSVDQLVRLANQLRPRVVAIEDERFGREGAQRFDASIDVRIGPGALLSLCDTADVVVNAVVGFAGLPVTLRTLESGRRLALANKESLVAGGPLVAKALSLGGGELLPIDSEHGAIHQCLRSETATGAGDLRRVRRIILTASGGPFRTWSAERLESITPDDALAHPTWKMGPKISVDSSTLFNKGLEVIEAHELFGIPYDEIDVVIHPQSMLHSAVEFTDGSVIGQLSQPDMRLPIGYALGHPDRLTTPVGLIDWAQLGELSFEAVDRDRFRCLDLAYVAGRQGGVAPTWLNAANEVAVEAFLNRVVTWGEISAIIEKVLGHCDGVEASSLGQVLSADASARQCCLDVIEKLEGSRR